MLDTIRNGIIGNRVVMQGPYGPRPVVYADYTASGRALQPIESIIQDAVLPRYANTHTESSGTGLQTTRFREEARAIIRRCVGADDAYAVLFTGTGSTGAIDKLIRVLGLHAQGRWVETTPTGPRPLVLIGPYEHHSNELPWRESVADVVVVAEDADGGIDVAHLHEVLAGAADRPLVIGSFSAASNVTGITSDVQGITRVLHEHGALACWDYAAAAPYVAIDVAPGDGEPLDAIYISTHKFAGGPGTPGLLVARRELFTNPVPSVPGGGTVAYVNAESHEYLAEVEHREEGGTPDIVGAIRAGLVFAVKESVGLEVIRQREEVVVRRAIDRWRGNPAIQVLGNPDRDRLSIVSFVIDAGGGRRLHHNLVVAMLNDLFGIQARGGCSCAGPYGHRLLGIDDDRSLAFRRQITDGAEGIKPGWVRVNFNYFIDDDEVEYILRAVELIALHGVALIGDYDFDLATGLWRHHDGAAAPVERLEDLLQGVLGGQALPPPPRWEGTLDLALAEAEALLRAGSHRVGTAVDAGDFDGLRWFPLRGDAAPSAAD